MKAAIAIGCVLLAVSSARGQFSILSDNRSVSAYAQWQYDVFLPDPPRMEVEVERDEQSMTAEPLMPFDARVTAAITEPVAFRTATAWQRSHATASEIFIAGGTEDASVNGVLFYPGSASSNSMAAIDFSLAVPTDVRVQYEVVDMGIVSGGLPCPLECQYSGGAGLTINGPGFEIVVTPDDGIIEPWPDDPIMFDQILLFAPGEYSIWANASASAVGDEGTNVPSDVSFMVRLTPIPIPEPCSVLLATSALAFPLWKIAKHKWRGRQRSVPVCRDVGDAVDLRSFG